MGTNYTYNERCKEIKMSEEGTSDGGGMESVESEGLGNDAPVVEDSELTPDIDGATAEDTNPIKETAERMLRKYKVRVDGEDQEVGEDELINNYQLRKASDKRFQEGQQGRKQSEEFIRLLKTDPAKVLSHPSVGMDVKKWAEEFLIGEMQRDMMTPEEKQMEEYKSKLARYEQAEATTKKQQEAEAEATVRQKYQDDYSTQITGALETSGLPKTEYTVQRMIHYMSKALEHNYEVSAKDVTDLVRRDYITDTKSLYSGLDADALLAILGDDVAGKIRKADLAKLKNPKGGKVKNNSGVSTSVRAEKSDKMSKDQWRDMLDNLTD